MAKRCSVVLLFLVVVITAITTPEMKAQSDRDHDCNGVCQALGLSAEQCWEHVHGFHGGSRCTNWFDGNDLFSVGGGYGVCNVTYGFGRGDAAFACGQTSGGDNYCQAAGRMLCGGQLRTWSLGCSSREVVPRITTESDEVYCETGEGGSTVLCSSSGNLVYGYWGQIQ